MCAVINSFVDLGDVTGMNSVRLGDVTETNRTKSPRQQTTGNWRSRTGTRQDYSNVQLKGGGCRKL